ncbi:MAG: patatin-like phospholipase family protein [Candidatus Paceibacterota bacterium]|jgi:NTE family protein
MPEKKKQSSTSAHPTRKKIGLALGGGGAKGLAHIGVIRQLETWGVPIDYIAGTSMGALIGAWYALKQDTDLVATVFSQLKNHDVHPLKEIVGKKNGALFRDSSISSLLEKGFGSKTFTDCGIPFAAVATDVSNGSRAILDSGTLADAVRASIALPLIFAPVADKKGRLLMDGGFSDPVPADVVRAMGADVVIAVDVSSRWIDLSVSNIDVRDMYTIVSSALSVVEYQIAKQILETADVVVRPPVMNYSWLSFNSAQDIIDAGADEVRQYSSTIARLSGVAIGGTKTPLENFFDFIRGANTSV